MADAILVPYLHTEDAISTEKKEVFTLENFDLSASCGSNTSNNYITSGWGSYGNTSNLCFSFGSNPIYSDSPVTWINDIMSVLGSELCDVSKCVVNITSQLISYNGVQVNNNAEADIAIAFGYKTQY